jgi:hypothetical protein
MKIMILSSHTCSLIWFRLDMMKEFIKGGHEVIAVGSDDEEKWKDRFGIHSVKYKKVPVERNGYKNKIINMLIFLSIKLLAP